MNCTLILLAAGLGTRFGGDKLTYPVAGKPMYRHILERLCDLRSRDPGLRLVAVVRGKELAAACQALGVDWVENLDSGRGISSSIRLGLEQARPDLPCAFFAADQPELTGETIERFLAGFLTSGKGLGCVTWGGKLGNPCAFSPRYIPQLMALEGDVGGKRIIRRHMDDLYTLEAANAQELMDWDRKPEM